MITRIGVALPIKLKIKIIKQAIKCNVSLSKFVRAAVVAFIKTKPNKRTFNKY